jgi:hypothetical protein
VQRSWPTCSPYGSAKAASQVKRLNSASNALLCCIPYLFQSAGQSTLPSSLVTQLTRLLAYLRKLPGDVYGSLEQSIQRSYSEIRAAAMSKALESLSKEIVNSAKAGGNSDKRGLGSFLDALFARAKVRSKTHICCYILLSDIHLDRPNTLLPALSLLPAQSPLYTVSFCLRRSPCFTRRVRQ